MKREKLQAPFCKDFPPLVLLCCLHSFQCWQHQDSYFVLLQELLSKEMHKPSPWQSTSHSLTELGGGVKALSLRMMCHPSRSTQHCDSSKYYLSSSLYLIFLWCQVSKKGPFKMLGRCSTTELHPSPFLVLEFIFTWFHVKTKL